MAIALRRDYDAARLRTKARESRDAGQTRRLLALAAICDGASRINLSLTSETRNMVLGYCMKTE